MKPRPAVFINNIRDARVQGQALHNFFHLFHKYLLSICFMPGSSLGAEDAGICKTKGPSRSYGIVEDTLDSCQMTKRSEQLQQSNDARMCVGGD